MIYIHRIPYAKLFDAVYSHVEFCTASSWDSVSTVLPVICAYRQGNLYHEHLLDQQQIMCIAPLLLINAHDGIVCREFGFFD